MLFLQVLMKTVVHQVIGHQILLTVVIIRIQKINGRIIELSIDDQKENTTTTIVISDRLIFL